MAGGNHVVIRVFRRGVSGIWKHKETRRVSGQVQRILGAVSVVDDHFHGSRAIVSQLPWHLQVDLSRTYVVKIPRQADAGRRDIETECHAVDSERERELRGAGGGVGKVGAVN